MYHVFFRFSHFIYMQPNISPNYFCKGVDGRLPGLARHQNSYPAGVGRRWEGILSAKMLHSRVKDVYLYDSSPNSREVLSFFFASY